MPRFDGLIAAGGRLYLSTADGTVVCLGAERGQPLEPAPEATVTVRPPDPILKETPAEAAPKRKRSQKQ
jgi:hypothetical protein